MELELTGRHVLVVGGSKGIGYSVAARLAAEQACVTIVARGEEDLHIAVETLSRENDGVDVRMVVADAGNPAEMAAAVRVAVDDNGVLHGLVTNTGGPPVGRVLDKSNEDWLNAFDQVVLGTLNAVRAAATALSLADGVASIACINSYIYREPTGERGLSNVPRAGLTALVKTLAIELAAERIRINNICPGPIWTERAQELLAALARRANTSVEEEKRKLIESRLLVPRYGEPDDVASMVAFLLSARAGFITGASIPIDGGMVRSLT